MPCQLSRAPETETPSTAFKKPVPTSDFRLQRHDGHILSFGDRRRFRLAMTVN